MVKKQLSSELGIITDTSNPCSTSENDASAVIKRWDPLHKTMLSHFVPTDISSVGYEYEHLQMRNRIPFVGITRIKNNSKESYLVIPRCW